MIFSKFDTNIVMMLIFLSITMYIGFNYGKSVKTIQEYALGGRKFNTFTLASTIIATWMSGSFFSIAITETYQGGQGFFLGIAYVLNLLIVSYFFAPRASKFLGSFSVAEVMGYLYGSRVRTISAVVSIFLAICSVALQVKVFLIIFSDLFLINPIYSTIICTLTVIAYSAFGGIRSVTFTDVFQLITFCILIPLIAIIIWRTSCSTELLVNLLQTDPAFDYHRLFDFGNYSFWVNLFLFIYYLIPSLNPAFFQRILLAKDNEQGKKAFAISSVICLIIYCLSCFIGLMTLAYKPGLNSSEILPFALNNFTYPIMKSFLLIGIVAMVMSTSDSWLNAASVMFSHDLCRPLKLNTNELVLSRIFTVFMGIGTIIVTLYTDSLLEVVLIGANFYAPIVTMPLMVGLFGFRTSGRVILITMSISAIVVLIWRYKIQPITGIDSVIPGMITSFISIFLIHYILGEKGALEKIEKRK